MIKDNLNLTYCYERELQFWHNQFINKDKNILKRLDPLINYDCPYFILDILDKIVKTTKYPKIMDFGCGPFSNISFLHKNKLAELIGVDVLASKYKNFYIKNSIEQPIPLIESSGENLLNIFDEQSFDFVYTQNALDHTLCPILSWINLYKLTKIGGYIGHCHAIDEAYHEKQDQLHQFNLRPENSNLILDDLSGTIISLNSGMKLSIVFESILPIKDNYSYFVQIWEKTGDDLSNELLLNTINGLIKTFNKRSNWCSNLELFLLENNR